MASQIHLLLALKTMKCPFLSFDVPVKPGTAKDLIETDDIGFLQASLTHF